VLDVLLWWRSPTVDVLLYPSIFLYVFVKARGWLSSGSDLREYVFVVSLLNLQVDDGFIIPRSHLGNGPVPLVIPAFGIIVCALVHGHIVHVPHSLWDSGVLQALSFEVCDILMKADRVYRMVWLPLVSIH